MKANVIVFEAAVLIASIVFYQGARRALGRSRNRAFLAGSVFFWLVIETGAVLGGLKNYYWYAQNDYYSHYPLGGYVIWLGLVPVAVVLLWYMVCASAYITSINLVPRRSVAARSAVAGAIAGAFYMLVEPIAVTNHWWTWNVKSFYLIDVPLLGVIAVFMSVFLFTTNFHATAMDMSDIKILKTLEGLTVRRWPEKSEGPINNLRWTGLLQVYFFRLACCLVVFVVAMAPVMVVLWLVANRGQIPPGW